MVNMHCQAYIYFVPARMIGKLAEVVNYSLNKRSCYTLPTRDGIHAVSTQGCEINLC